MVTKAELAEALAANGEKQLEAFKNELNEGISKIRSEIIERLTEENSKLKETIVKLDKKVVDLEIKVEANLQYQRFASVVISGIPASIDHRDLEESALKIFNHISNYEITQRDLVAVHRISAKSSRVLCKFLNRRDATCVLDGKGSLVSYDNQGEAIYVEGHLTPYISDLAFKCRCLKRQKLILKTNVRKGVVRICKETEDGEEKWFIINHVVDITNHFPDFI